MMKSQRLGGRHVYARCFPPGWRRQVQSPRTGASPVVLHETDVNRCLTVISGVTSTYSDRKGDGEKEQILKINTESAFSPDAEQCVQCPAQEYPNSERNRCLPKVLTFLAFKDFLGMSLACMALCFGVITAEDSWIFVTHRDTPIVKANNGALRDVLLISLLLCLSCSLLFIGCPNTATCILQQITFRAVFAVAVATVLAKTLTVILVFKARTPGRTMGRLQVTGASNYVIPMCSLIRVIICGVWLGTSPPFLEMDTHSDPKELTIMCNKGSVTAFYCVLGYPGSLALGTLSLAFLAGNLPDTFNEAKFLTFTMLVFCRIWVTFLPVYHKHQGQGHGGCGDLLHLGLQCWASKLYLCPKVLHYS
ncbi:unnamed protein product [Rangifer tarandus platyrhynchus]|uniref:G-protein coupled receptors family 3 profile domain-containing protein n=2 Tax=Rangifer tarandus platyrhynchus TaxID=3082113 RepID=A0ABN8ZEG3_RANTA|nr:unnamed protein product [Rangifer tarandus platyrhynchus]